MKEIIVFQDWKRLVNEETVGYVYYAMQSQKAVTAYFPGKRYIDLTLI